MPVLPTTGPGEAVGEDAAVEIAAELLLDVGGYRVTVTIAIAGKREPSLEVRLHGAI